MKIAGGCHCGAVRFSAQVKSPVDLLDCNCSICTKSGYLHLIVPHEAFELVSGSEALTSYRFGTGTAEHLFCRKCGTKPFYQPRSHPKAWSVNFRCLDLENIPAHRVVPFDGRNWETAREALER